MANKKRPTNTMREIAKNNPQVNEQSAAEFIELITKLRNMGVRPKGFNILGVSDSRLKVRKQAVFSLRD